MSLPCTLYWSLLKVSKAAFVADPVVRSEVADRLLTFWRFFKEHAAASAVALSVRDLLAWVSVEVSEYAR
jgi:hypothetical protein